MLFPLRPIIIFFTVSFLMVSTASEAPDPDWRIPASFADSLQQQKKYHEAAEYWEQALNHAAHAGDSIQQMLTFKQLYAKAVSFDYEKEGIPFFEKAYPLLPYSRLDTSAQSTFLNTYYHFLGYNNRWEEALPFAQECAALRESLNEDPPLAYLSSVHDVAYIQNKIGNYPEAIEFYLKSINGYIAHNGEQDHDVALGYNNLAFNYGLMGMANKQYAYYVKAANTWNAIEVADNSYLMTVYGNLLRWQKEYGDHTAVEGILASMREVANNKNKEWGSKNRLIENKKDDENVRLILSYWKACLDYHLQKKHIHGIQNYLDSTSRFIKNLSKKPDDQLLEYLHQAYSVLGEAHAESDNHEEAIRIFRAGFDHMAQYGYGTPSPHQYAKYAKSLIATGQLDEADLQLQEAFNRNTNRANLPQFHILMAQLAEKRHQPDSVRLHVGRTLAALTGSDEFSNDFTSITASSFLGRVNRNYIACLSAGGHHLLKLYRHTKLHNELRQAQHLFTLALDMLNVYYLGGPYTDALADMQTAIHFGLLECQTFMQQQKADAPALATFFENLENNRSQHRWKKFVKHAPSNSTAIPDSLRDAEEEQRQLIVFYKQQLAKVDRDSLQGKQANRWRAKIYACEVALANTEEQLLALNARYMTLSQGMVTTRTLQKGLPKQVSMLRYMLTDSGAYVMRIDRSSLVLFPLGRTDSVELLVREATAQLQTRSPDYYVTATKLHARLLGAEISKGLHRNLIIVPDGILHQLPFEALTNTENPSGFLLHTHTVSYATSAALWMAQQGLRYNKSKSFGAFAPNYAGVIGEERSGTPLKLTGATSEAETIAKMLEGSIYQQNSFGKQDFLNEAPNYSLLHLAMHANVREDDSEHSNFHFGDGSKLYAYELYGMRLQANMAVLSACNTGYGSLQKGEGMQSLATAFTYAGVPSLVMGLWSLPDASTSGIMVDYYQQLVDRKYKHTALATAKTNYLKRVANENELQHPFYWAGLVISGDTQPIRQRGATAYWVFAGLLGAAGLALVRYRKRHQ